MSMSRQAGIVRPGYNALLVPNAPTIGTATNAGATSASVTFTAPSCTGGSVISTYTAFCTTTGTNTTTGASSPLVVTGLTTGSTYTFKVVATNIYGPSYPSAASNSVVPAVIVTCATYTTAGTYSWVAPTGVTSVAVVAVGGGGGGNRGTGGASCGGGGGGLGYKNAYSVTPGSSYTVVVGAGGYQTYGGCSYFVSTAVVKGGRGGGGACVLGGTYTGDGGGNGGRSGSSSASGGGGAGGYSGNGGAGGNGLGANGSAGAGGGGGGGGANGYFCYFGCQASLAAGGGGGVGLYGSGSSGTGGTKGSCGVAGTGGGGGSSGNSGGSPTGGLYGGGAGAPGQCGPVTAARGAVRIVWCSGGSRGTPSFPSTNVGP